MMRKDPSTRRRDVPLSRQRDATSRRGENFEIEISDEDQVLLLLCSLPSSYKTLRETLIYGRDNLLFEDVKRNLLSKDKFRNRNKYSDYCKKLGYVKAEC
ncbi:hypothetical protein PVK06_027769 [Gossypium arboreum]|uniref:Uncharacterized protein n=1 Tax=Gossypium arboreum TaxID=29729 RepID=A0ABR0P182_GOSAR|nr:hypothetical protein PVK06_027769 [Gossypium arboreum]